MQSLWMVVAGFFFALMGVCVKLAAASFSAPELVFYRSVLALVFVFLIARARRVPLATPHWRMQLFRGVSGFVSLLLYFYAITLLPLATAVTLSYTSPLFLAGYLSLLGIMRLKSGAIAALALGFAGVALLLRPTLAGEQVLGGAVGLAGGMIAGLAYLGVRELGERGENEERTVFYFTLLSTVFAAAWVMFGELHPLDTRGSLLLLGLGVSGTVAQLAMTRAYRRGNTMLSASLAYLTVVFASLFGVLFWGESLSPDAWLAIALIVASGVLSARFARNAAGSAQ